MEVPCIAVNLAQSRNLSPLTRALARFHEALKKWPRPGTGVHGYIMRLANLARHAGLSEEKAIEEITAAMPRAATPATEVDDAVRKAYSSCGWQPETAEKKIKLLPETQRAFIALGKGASEAAWRKMSPVPIPSEPSAKDAQVVLGALWQDDEVLYLGDTYDKNVATVREWREKFQAGQPIPPHVIPNPVKPEGGLTLEGKPSFRCDDAVASFRYAVAEMDDMPKADQLRFWWGFESAPIVALIDSGGKSIHAWLRVDCPDRVAWERDVEQKLFPRVLIPLGCDPACRNESRLSRMPGHYRSDMKAWQRLLYLNPNGGAR